MAERSGDVGFAGEAQGADREVAAGGEGAGAVACEGLGAVLVEGDIADVVDPVLDAPVPADETVEFRWACLVGGEAGEVERGLGGDELVVEVGAFAVDPDDLFGVGEQVWWRRRGGGGLVIDAAVTPARRCVLRGKRTLRGGP